MEKKLVVAYGKSLTSKKGIVGQGQAVDASYFVDGEKVIEGLKEKGYLVTWAEYKKALHYMGIKDDTAPEYVEAEPAAELPELKLSGVKKKS